MSQQLSFDLPSKAALGREAFFVSPANANALAMVEADAGWPSGKLLVVGPRGAGKTHLAHVWAAQSGAVILAASDLSTPPDEDRIVVEDIDRIAGDPAAEEALFHLHNATLSRGGKLMLTGTGSPAGWRFALPDLASRVQGTALVGLEPPDDALLTAVLVKLFADRQLSPTPAVLTYVLRHMDRSFEAAAELVDVMDRKALSEHRAITRDLAREVLGQS